MVYLNSIFIIKVRRYTIKKGDVCKLVKTELD